MAISEKSLHMHSNQALLFVSGKALFVLMDFMVGGVYPGSNLSRNMKVLPKNNGIT